MFHLKIYNLVRVVSLFCFSAITWEYWGNNALGLVFLLTPYVLVFVLATQKTYSSKIKIICRVVAGAFVSLLSVGLLFGIDADPQAPIGIGLTVIIQYCTLFVAEAIIGLATYKEVYT